MNMETNRSSLCRTKSRKRNKKSNYPMKGVDGDYTRRLPGLQFSP